MSITTAELLGLVTPPKAAMVEKRTVRDGKTVKRKKRKNNPETLRAYREANAAKIAAMKLRWKAANPERAKKSQAKADAKRYWANPEKYRAKALARWNAVGAAARAAARVRAP